MYDIVCDNKRLEIRRDILYMYIIPPDHHRHHQLEEDDSTSCSAGNEDITLIVMTRFTGRMFVLESCALCSMITSISIYLDHPRGCDNSSKYGNCMTKECIRYSVF